MAEETLGRGGANKATPVLSPAPWYLLLKEMLKIIMKHFVSLVLKR